MEIKLEAPLIRGYAASPRDVREVKRVLGCIGYYIPDPETGVTEEAEPGFWIALKAFQRAQMIPFYDVPGPGSVTERILNRELAELESGNGLYTWRTVGDEKVRGEHAVRAGRRFRWDDPPDGEYPGEDYNCRCWAEPLSPSRHILAEEARREQLKRMAPAHGLSVPAPILIQPGLDAINPSIGPVELLAGVAVLRAGGGSILSTLQRSNIRDKSNVKQEMQASSFQKQVQDAYQKALEGGKHAGFLKRYQNATEGELKRGINSLNTQIKEHVQKIKNPEKEIPNFRELDIRKQKNLIEDKWPSDIRRLEEQKEILRRIKDGKQ